ncbi:type VI secretion system tube protein Hcp, partial [Proteus mirabilis]
HETFYTIKLPKASITNISAPYPNSLTPAAAQPYEDLTIRYESISWHPICEGTSGCSISRHL